MRRLALLLIVAALAAPVAAGAQTAAEKRFQVPPGDSPSLGPADARVTVVEFIDFQ